MYLLFYFFSLYFQLTLYTYAMFTGCSTPLHSLFDLVWTTWISSLHSFFLLFPDAADLSWTVLVLYCLTSVLVSWVLEGAWWTFFLWFKSFIALVLYYWTELLAAHREQYLFRRDVRFTFRASLSVKLTGFNTILPRSRWNSRSSIYCYNQFSIRVRLRLRYQRAHEPKYRRVPPVLPTQKERRSVLPSVSSRIATRKNLTPQDRNEPSRPVAQATKNYMEYYKACTDRSYPKFRDTLDFESYYGMSKQAAQRVLLSLTNPLDWYLQEKRLLTSNLISTASEAARLQQGYYAALALVSNLGFEGARPQNVGAFLSQDPSGVPLIFDTGCGHSITPILDDFVTALGPPPDGLRVQDFANGTQAILGVGWVEWKIRDSLGRSSIIRTKCYYVPAATVRLFCPGQYQREQNRDAESIGHYAGSGDGLTFTDEFGNNLFFKNAATSTLPTMTLDDAANQVGITDRMVHNVNVIRDDASARQIFDEANWNLSKPQQELQLWHCRLGHAGAQWIQDLMRVQKDLVGDRAGRPFIPTKLSSTHTCKPPKCSACLFAKQHRLTPGTQTTKSNPDREMAIRRDDLRPGDCISGDHYMSSTPGRLPNTYGKEQESARYTGGTIWVDHASALMFNRNQVTLTAGETIQSKHAFERFARLHGVTIKRYRADNQPFDSQLFKDDIALQEQALDFSGVGAHFQNGVAERAVQTVSSWARAMMMHQAQHWPEAFSEDLWPFAVDQAVYLWNNMPRQRSGLTPLELFTGTKQPSNGALLRARVWGCPSYVLDPTLQSGHKIPKWKQRSRCGVYLGNSAEHADSVGRILNPKTGAISNQYHVVYDELFHTAFGALTDKVLDKTIWEKLLLFGSEENLLTSDDSHNPAVVDRAVDLFDDFRDDDDELEPLDTGTPAPEGDVVAVDSVPEGDGDSFSDPNETSSTASTQVTSNRSPYTTRSGRSSQPPRHYVADHSNSKRYSTTNPALLAALGRPDSQWKGAQRYAPHVRACYLAGGNSNARIKQKLLDEQLEQSLNWDPDSFLDGHSSARTRKVLLALLQSIPEGEWNPMALAAKKYDENSPSYEMAMNGPNREGYIEACNKEIQTLIDMGVWELVDREPWMNVLPSTWALKAKLFPSGLIRKLKARLCCRGDKQIKNVDYFETFAPVVSWTTVRLLLILSAELELATRQVDYTAAFVHADIDRPPNWDQMSPEEQARSGVYVEMARGYREPGKVYKLKKSLYGLRQSGRNFFLHLKANLEAIGFEQQVDFDPCLFISPKVICLVYVDDTLLYARRQEDIDEVIHLLRDQQGMTLEAEDEVAGFLGVHIRRDEVTGQIELTQEGLTDRIISALGCDNLPGVTTPADEVLGKDEDGEPANCTFNYASVIGMLWYLYGHSRPDLGFAVSQAARFAFAPKRSHELALIRIGQYLKETRKRGMILKPMSTSSFRMDAYVDSDFMGLYGKEKRTDPTNVKSRTGFVICVNDCPIVWSSKLQDGVALSTMMAEYYALSTCMREVLPLRALTKGVAKGLGISDDVLTEFRTTVWEDNNGALSLANLEPGQSTPRSKFYDCKVHWFRSHITREGSATTSSDGIYVQKIDTTVQLADIFTKPLPRDVFEHLRHLLIGW